MAAELNPLIAFGAGILSVSSPCVLPLLPAIMAYSVENSKWRPFFIVVGLTTTFTLLGIVSSVFGRAVGMYLPYLKMVAGAVIILLGATMLFELGFFNRFAGLVNPDPTKDRSGPLGGFVLGTSLGIVWIPCVGPILGAILMMVAFQGNVVTGGFLLFVYSMGLGIPMLALAYLVNMSSTRLRMVAKYDAQIKRAAGAVLMLVGISMVTGML